MGGLFGLKNRGGPVIITACGCGSNIKKETLIMKQRTLVHMIFGVDNISLRTVNRTRKSPHRFYIQKHSLEELEHRSWIIVHDISSFAVLHRGASYWNDRD